MPLTKEKWDELLDSPQVKNICAQIAALDETAADYADRKQALKKRLPIIIPHAQSFKNGKRVSADAVPSGLAMLDVDHDGKPELVLRADDESFRAVYSVALTTSLLAGENGSRFLSFYNNAVCHSGSCGALCMSSVYVMLRDSDVKSYLTDTSEWDMQLDSYGDSVFTLDGKEISKEEAEKMLRTLGKAYEPDLKWTRMAVD